MKPYILFISLLCAAFQGIATDFQFSNIPLKDGIPYYEQIIPIRNTADKHELFHRVPLFLAEYFKKTAPEIKIEDKEDGVIAASIILSYNFLDNPEIYHGRCRCLLNVKIGEESCKITVYNFELFHQDTRSKLKATSNGLIPQGEMVWNREKETEVYKNAAGNKQGAIAEMKAMHERVIKLEEALAKKLAN